MANTRKIEWIDRAKGLGIILVVLGHVIRGLNNAELFNGAIFINTDYIIYTFHMPLFFFLSGIFFLKSLQKRGLRVFLKDKFSLLFYLYMLWSVIQFIVQLSLDRYTNGNTNIADILDVFVLPKGQMWFLYVLLLIFSISAFLYHYVQPKWHNYLLASLIIVGIFLRVYDIDFWYVAQKFGYNFLFFQLGILYALHGKQMLQKLTIKWSLALMVVSLFAFSAVVLFNINNQRLNYDNQIIPAILGVLAVIFIVVLLTLKSFSYLGKYSLEIYLAHILFASGTRIVLDKFFGVSNLGIHLVFGLSVGLIAPLVLIEITKRFKLLKFLFKNPLTH
ncbi:acyltransferase [Winogradskyella sp. DF17]|uniref:Acyltransferase n=1 Tax=Winogradskyella pelagia TaxID=2819984 RepID=A0ABS3T0E8_9FLAO|nr:acyltransferase [Winogradskyella sp. DF17]MBO3115225.1 acyltransferase [Winogradskyella sp. DF17]